jgi:hypothetical protein
MANLDNDKSTTKAKRKFVPCDDFAASNSLTDLAARIKAEHMAAAASLRDSVRHAIMAGEMLIEAKTLVPHGQWQPWLADHVAFSERTGYTCGLPRIALESRIRCATTW